MLLVVDIYFYCMFDLLNELSIFLIYIGLSIFLNLNFCFLKNSKLITNSVALLSNSTSTIIPSYVSTLSSLIFTITSLNNFSFAFLTSFFFSLILSKSNISTFISLASILNLLLESSQGI